MYKLNNKTYSILKIIISIAHWAKRKLILIMTAFMLGISNAMYHEDGMPNDNQNKTEQKQ